MVTNEDKIVASIQVQLRDNTMSIIAQKTFYLFSLSLIED